MKLNRALATALITLAICAIPAHSQNVSTQSNESVEPGTQLKLQIVLTEMDGSKKISSLPYTLRVLASAHPEKMQFKTGVRVPVRTGGKDAGEYQMQYIDVGTNINSTAKPLDGGRYQLSLQVSRSIVYVSSGEDKPIPWAPSAAVLSGNPIIQQFSDNCDLVIRDGQTVQATIAGDPVTGHVMTMDVTINVDK